MVQTTWHIWPVTGDRNRLYAGIKQGEIEIWDAPNGQIHIATQSVPTGEYLPAWFAVA